VISAGIHIQNILNNRNNRKHLYVILLKISVDHFSR